ncbi:hypothetical protein N7491_005409 [Penicillium cf. griseofulvum]|uniref:Uncharacterized protein n=1 Tax=Penicillium cf. griseofulvum TaxID=2972120 RepID=A0A9W9M477_9EURO|nr:hypothetical protein N7472_008100 [Penicillium cf. griseofulvum]KAJ5434814.1 hypothetical protein N7491_005409 [Penicillium cf. griseofulvum]KAJ5452647.1 hypothetical protein N7445_000830 [Penicillium cf. griseofulvum]
MDYMKSTNATRWKPQRHTRSKAVIPACGVSKPTKQQKQGKSTVKDDKTDKEINETAKIKKINRINTEPESKPTRLPAGTKYQPNT